MRVVDFFDEAARHNPQRMLVADASGSAQFCFEEGVQYTHEVANGLRAVGVEVGDAVGILAPNCPDALLTMFALWRAGAAWVPLNPRNALGATIAFAQEVGLKWLFLHSDFAGYAERLQAEVPTLKQIVSLGADFVGAEPLGGLIAAGRDIDLEDWNDAFGRRDLVCALVPTGGTTGSSKPVMLTNDVWVTLVDITSRHFPPTERPVNLVSAPITHAAGLLGAVLACQGAGNVMLPAFHAGHVLDAIEQHAITHMFLPPTALYDLVDEQRRTPRDLSTMKLLWLAAAPVSPDRLRQAVEVLGPVIGQSFGQAEAPGFITWMTPEEIASAAAGVTPARLSSCGRPTSGTQVAIMADDGALLGPEEHGEIVVRGHLVTPGYYERPNETRAVREHNWHHTGDIGHIDTDGYVYIVDRKKDMIISGGFNVYPSEVEAALLRMPEIKQCAVVGVPDDGWGEMVMAEVVPSPGVHVDVATLIATAKKELGSLKAPKMIQLVEALPHTAAGKIDKKAIRGKYWEGSDRQV